MERLDAFMARANAAYYAERDPYADFTTSPEITQVFGELLGLWAAIVWEGMGRPDPVLLAECGPGRGTLMADALRAIRRVAPGFGQALRLHLVETSPRLRARQAALLPGAAWHDRVCDLPDGPLLLLGNEFLDALPIRQFVRRGGGWTERFVADGAFVELPAAGLGPDFAKREVVDPDFAKREVVDLDAAEGEVVDLDAAEGEVAERCEAAEAVVRGLAERVAATGGAVLLLDYGPEASAAGDSLQALRGGEPAAPLLRPGEADLTAHVDFACLARVARAAGATVHGPTPQGPFLARLGLFQRTDRLARTQPPARAAALVQAAQRLAEPDRMGRLFKALALCHPALPTPPGFDQ